MEKEDEVSSSKLPRHTFHHEPQPLPASVLATIEAMVELHSRPGPTMDPPMLACGSTSHVDGAGRKLRELELDESGSRADGS